MSERGIIMQAESVRAILAGIKTQTRRVYKPRNPEPWELPPGEGYKDDGTPWPMYQDTYGDFHPVPCPYGAPGDRLWVKEAWKPLGSDDIAYRASEDDMAGPWLSPLFLKREHSRLTLEVVAVRVQRVQEISEADARAEGCSWSDGAKEFGQDTEAPFTARDAYANTWDGLNAKRGYPWASNPWVWAVTFRRVERAVDGRA